MNRRGEHIIHTANLNFQFHETEDQLSIPTRLEQWFLNEGERAISSVCNACCVNDEYIEIDQLYVDIGYIGLEEFNSEMSMIFENKLRQSLQRSLAVQSKNSIVESPAHTPIGNGVIDNLRYFLDHGYLPWNSLAQTIEQLETEFLALDDSTKEQLVVHLLPQLTLARIRKRLAFNFSGHFFDSIRKHIDEITDAKLISVLKTDFIPESYSEKMHFLETINELLSNSGFAENIIQTDGLMDDAEKNQKETPGPSNKALDAEVGINITDAGLVLMHPFIPTLFSKLGYVEEGNFINDKAREYAVAALCFMARGEVKFDEGMAVLPKILCGLDPSDAFQQNPALGNDEQREIEVAVQAAIDHWSVLKSTGIESFRNTFLLRNGQLSVSESAIEITVEQNGADMLLQHLPWALSVVNLPWQSKNIIVNWA